MPGPRVVPAVALAAVVLLASLVLGACGAESPRASDHNDADVAFVRAMLPHHEQAVAMVALTGERALRPETAALAQEVRAAQQPQVEQMRRWLAAWDADGDAGAGGASRGASSGAADPDDETDETADAVPDEMADGMAMGGETGQTMTQEQMDRLGSAPDGSFERLWLQVMIEHHRGALEMARAELEQGRHPGAVALAREVEDTQAAEITRMQRLLASDRPGRSR